MVQKQEGGAAGAGGVGVRGRSQGRGHAWQVSVRVWVLFQWYRRRGRRGLKPCWLWNLGNQLEGGEGGHLAERVWGLQELGLEVVGFGVRLEEGGGTLRW